ncbi:MAG: glycosyl hydrolase family 95 catalytic domain-containing protein [Bacteroides sp.]
MKRFQTTLLIPLFCCPMSMLQAQVESPTHKTAQPLTIWFDTPTTLQGALPWYHGKQELWQAGSKHIDENAWGASDAAEWERVSLPIGNGNLGANIMGSIEAERITFNEKSLWRGGPNTAKGADYYWNVNKESAHLLPEIRQAFTDGDLKKASELTRKNFNSTVSYQLDEQPYRFGNFTTMGEFYVETGLSTVGTTNYRRALSLDSALATVEFTKEKVHYRRQYFISYPHNVMVMRFSADKPGKQNLTFSYAPNPDGKGTMKADGNQSLCYEARLNNNQMAYTVRMTALPTGGSVRTDDGRLIVEQADEVTFLVTADTDYKINFDPDFNDPLTYVGVNPSATTAEWMKEARELGYDRLLQDHLADYQPLFQRVKLALNPASEASKATDIPTPQRLKNYRRGQADYYLETLYYQFGRYLLIASSRPGNLPANLQGIWANQVDGPWHVDYHNNINLQMNYWPACSTGLSECVEPLIDFIRTLQKPGERTAKAYFGARGWTASISGNIFGFTTPLRDQDMSWNFNPMAGPWLATHLWEYYDYTRDMKFLRETAYPLIRESAIFAADYLWHKPDGTYTAAPSTSPEHGPIDQGATFVHAVIREILLEAIEGSRLLKCDKEERARWEDILANLAPYSIGRYGQLMEWSRDIDDPNDHHRHVNHLFGLHPGHTVSPITTPELAQASRVVLEHRGDGATGWSMGWKLNQWARLHDGNHAYTLYGNLLKNGTLDNLWDTHPPFQIDGNFGGTAGVTEMLLQSHAGFIHLLPSLPDAWSEGSVSGLEARGNFCLDLTWANGQLTEALLTSRKGGRCILRYGDQELTLQTRPGKSYRILYSDGKLVKK